MSTCICISRQYGSGGHRIAAAAARRLGIPCYDKELLTKAAQDSGIAEEHLRESDERAANPWLYSVLYEGQTRDYYGKNPNDILFEAQSRAIVALAQKGDSVFIGRCADVVLKEQRGCRAIRVFITAPMDTRIKNVMDREGVSEKEAARLIRKNDRQRRAYYEYYTCNDWGKPSDYDLTINAGSMTVDEAADLLVYLFNR